MKPISEYIEEYLWEDKSYEDQPDGTGVRVMSEGRVRELMKKYAEDVVDECYEQAEVIPEHQGYHGAYVDKDSIQKVKQQIK